MFGIGMPEMILILAIALIVIGPKKLPDLAKSLGRAMNEFKKATREIKESMDIEGDLQDVKKSLDDLNTDVKDAVDSEPSQIRQTGTVAGRRRAGRQSAHGAFPRFTAQQHLRGSAPR